MGWIVLVLWVIVELFLLYIFLKQAGAFNSKNYIKCKRNSNRNCNENFCCMKWANGGME